MISNGKMGEWFNLHDCLHKLEWYFIPKQLKTQTNKLKADTLKLKLFGSLNYVMSALYIIVAN